MSSTNIHCLFSLNRINNQQDFPKVLLYFPFGFVLLLFRLLVLGVALPILLFLPKDSRLRRYVLECVSFVLGIVVRKEMQKREEAVKLLVCNHVSVLDHLAVEPIFPCAQVNICSHFFSEWSLWSIYEHFTEEQRSNSNYAVLVFPECGTTNGMHGLLKFSSLPFETSSAVQPVVIEIVKSSFVNISPSVIGSSEWCDLLWLLFIPSTVYNLRVLPTMRKLDKESAHNFSKRIQILMASSLSITATEYTLNDKLHFERNMAFPSRNQSQSAVHQRNATQLNRMTEQVREILPDVPITVIEQDLRTTKSVDDTISRLLEGVINFEPESKSSPSSSGSQRNNKNPHCVEVCDKTSSSLNTAAEKFGKTPKDRMLSYQERKLALVEAARKRYIQKQRLKKYPCCVSTYEK